LELAWAEATRLKASGLLIEAPDDQLAGTEERLNWPGLWKHFWAPDGLASVLRGLLCDAQLDSTTFGMRADAVRLPEGRGCQVSGLRRVDGGATAERVTGVWDAVVLAVPTPDAIALGAASALSPADAAILRAIEYDARGAVAVFYAAADEQPGGDSEVGDRRRRVLARVAGLFADAGQAELEFTYDEEKQSGLHMLALQDVKSKGAVRICSGKGAAVGADDGFVSDAGAATPPATDTLTLVGHAVAGTSALAAWRVHAELARRLALQERGTPNSPGTLASPPGSAHLGAAVTASELEALTAHTRAVNWTVSQMVRPKEAVCDPVPPGNCLVDAGAQQQGAPARLVLAGDFMAQSSFLGCFASAHAAVEAVLRASK
jgi:hypothetical protein